MKSTAIIRAVAYGAGVSLVLARDKTHFVSLMHRSDSERWALVKGGRPSRADGGRVPALATVLPASFSLTPVHGGASTRKGNS